MFSLSLERNIVPPGTKWPEMCRKEPFEGERTNIISVLADVTDQMELIDLAKFSMTGFGIDWQVDIAFDLLSILKELPDLSAWIADEWEEPFVLAMSDRGADKDIVFERHAGKLILSLVEAHNPLHVYAAEVVEIDRLAEMINPIVQTFGDCTRDLCPNLYAHDWFNDWYTSSLIRPSGVAV